MEHLSDNDLLRQIKLGDMEAFNLLIERHYQAIYAFSYKFCNSQQDAEDITQDTLLKVAARIQSFNSTSKLTTWLYRVTINTAKDHFKKEAVRTRYHKDYSHELHSKDQGVENDESLGLWDLVKKLPSAQYEAVTLVYGEGLSHDEAGGVLGCAAATISWRIFSAKKKLRKKAQKLSILVLFIWWIP